MDKFPATRPPKLNAAGLMSRFMAPTPTDSSPLDVTEDGSSQEDLSRIISSHTASASFTPLDPADFFDSECEVRVPSRRLLVHVRTAGPPAGTEKCPVLLCIHGGGYCADTFAPLARRLKGRFRLVCPDLRGHGATRSEEGDEALEVGALVEDLLAFHETFFRQGRQPGGLAEDPPLMLVGHSLGGAVAARAAATRRLPKLEAVCVVDVVEGTALSSLPYIMQVLHSRPSSFASPEEAIHWAVRTRMTRCEESARVSVPGMLVQGGDGRLVWRTPLADSEPHWQGWYRGMSEVFVTMPGFKLLALAGTDRLDKTLTVAQMRGAFQLAVFPASGHPVHEDVPDEFAQTLKKFLVHFRIGQGPLVFPKRGETS